MEATAIYHTEVGNIAISCNNKGITVIKKIEGALTCDYGEGTLLTNRAYEQLCEYLNGKRKLFDLPLDPQGTDFQKKVWQALCDIPYGETRSYKQVATAIGNEKASRAVGLSNNRNPIMMVIPCHRVIGSSGKLVGYAGGLNMKKQLLSMEKENVKGDI